MRLPVYARWSNSPIAAVSARATSVSARPRPTLPAAMAACTTSSCCVKDTTSIGFVLKNISAKRSSGRLATNFESSSRAMRPLGSPRDWAW